MGQRQLLGSFGDVQWSRLLAVFGPGCASLSQSDNIAYQLKGVIKQAEELLSSSHRWVSDIFGKRSCSVWTKPSTRA